MAQFTGGSPRTTGIWYDDVWDWTYYPPGSQCQGSAGSEVVYDESIDYNSTMLFSGGIDESNLPLTLINGICTPIYPHQRLMVNTVFEVIHASGKQTAYVDKHPAYDIVRGPSGQGLSVGYFPEIAAVANTIDATITYDSLHVQAWLDFIDGNVPTNSSGGLNSMPALMAGNFQAVSVAQKTVGYNNDSSLSTGLLKALDFVDTSLDQIVSKLKAKGYLNDSLIIVASKHGQAPINPQLWNEVSPDDLAEAVGVPTAFITTDDIALIWLNNTADIPKAVSNLQANATALKIQEVIAGANLIQQGFGNPLTSSRVPHIIVRPQLGTCYTTSKAKIAEHGGLSNDDRNAACFVSNPMLKKMTYTGMVNTTQVAPTILTALGLNAQQLQAVVAEDTSPLEGFGAQWADCLYPYEQDVTVNKT
ncbi:hypothetical protein LTR10_018200 [Elasticomyces elasticus]|nr:hypothetical protein LTR10_018200 [Elasticomyces elasticus]KAK5031492.1 hypothetical protein LTR13_007820 [Exophiala sideris]